MNKTMIQIYKALMYVSTTEAYSRDVTLYMVSQDKLAASEYDLLSRIIHLSMWNLPQLLL